MFRIDEYCIIGEVWKDIPGYEGLYQASDMGRIRTVDKKETFTKRHGVRIWKGRILKSRSKDVKKSGYRVSLWKDGSQKDWLAHRLIALTFLGVPPGIKKTNTGKRMTVNHKDGDRSNNHISNLEWVTLDRNIKHAFENGLMPTKPVSLIGEVRTIEFASMSEAGRYLGKNSGYISGLLKKGIDEIIFEGNIYKVKKFGTDIRVGTRMRSRCSRHSCRDDRRRQNDAQTYHQRTTPKS